MSGAIQTNWTFVKQAKQLGFYLYCVLNVYYILGHLSKMYIGVEANLIVIKLMW